MKYLIIIPARGGSKGIPNKNIKLLDGKPLIHYTIEAAREVFEDADICVSTDSQEIKSVAEQTGLYVPFLRPEHLATDNAGTYDVLCHALDFFEKQDNHYDAIVLLQPTSPLREPQHIKEILQLFSSDIDMVVSVKETDSNPYYVLFEENQQGFLEKVKKGNFHRRQDCPKVWEYNGSIYVVNTAILKEKKTFQSFKKIVGYEMDAKYSLDLDTLLDWEFITFLLQKNYY